MSCLYYHSYYHSKERTNIENRRTTPNDWKRVRARTGGGGGDKRKFDPLKRSARLRAWNSDIALQQQLPAVYIVRHSSIFIVCFVLGGYYISEANYHANYYINTINHYSYMDQMLYHKKTRLRENMGQPEIALGSSAAFCSAAVSLCIELLLLVYLLFLFCVLAFPCCSPLRLVFNHTRTTCSFAFLIYFWLSCAVMPYLVVAVFLGAFFLPRTTVHSVRPSCHWDNTRFFRFVRTYQKVRQYMQYNTAQIQPSTPYTHLPSYVLLLLL